jgi:nitrate reductase assembly molybdenum cofactor insertion protein NarJ
MSDFEQTNPDRIITVTPIIQNSLGRRTSDQELNKSSCNGVATGHRLTPDHHPLLQSLRATVTNIDFVYARERDNLNKALTDSDIKAHLLARLRERHREQRDPYIQHIAVLQERIRCTINKDEVRKHQGRRHQ